VWVTPCPVNFDDPVMRSPCPSPTRACGWWAGGVCSSGRRALHVPMAELRDFIDGVRVRFHTPYPLAHRRPYVAGRQLLSGAQEVAGLEPALGLVAEVRGQYGLTGAAPTSIPDPSGARVEPAEAVLTGRDATWWTAGGPSCGLRPDGSGFPGRGRSRRRTGRRAGLPASGGVGSPRGRRSRSP